MACITHQRIITIIIWTLSLVAMVTSQVVLQVQENESSKFLFTQIFSPPEQNCNVTRVSNVGTTDLVLNLTQPVQDDGGVFSLEVWLVEPLDFEELQEKNGDTQVEVRLKVTFVCINGGLQEIELPKNLIIVTDVSDSVPEFQQERYEATIAENQPINTVVLYNVTAIDADGSDQVEYVIETSDTDRGVFDAIVTAKYVEGKNRQVLDISLLQPLDYETATRYSFTVLARDPMNFTSTCEVIIKVKDVQDSPPTFRQTIYSGRVDEMAPEGKSVVMVSAVDGDSSAIRNQIMYSIVEGPTNLLTVDNETGVIATTGQLDIDGNNRVGTNGLVILTVQAEEYNTSGEVQYGNTTARTYVQIQIDDANDHPPRFGSPTYSGSIRGEAVVGEIVSIDGGGYISVTDQDLSPSNNHFKLHIEKDGQPWTVFDTNIKSQFVQASVLITLNEPEALESLHNTHIKFQLVATDFSAPTSNANISSLSSMAEVMVFVMPRATTDPPPEAVVDLPISESDVIVFVMGFMLLLNIVLTLLICRLMSRSSGDRGLGFFRRNSKYYVSGRKRVDSGGVERVDSSSTRNQVGNASAVKEDVQNQTIIPPFSATAKERNSSVVTDPTINRNTHVRNTISSVASRNRCDVTHLDEMESGSAGNRRNSIRTDGNGESSKGDNSAKNAQPNRCDLAPLNTGGQTIQNKLDTSNSGNFKTGPSKCDVIPLEASISSTSRSLSSILDRVHQKLSPGSKMGKSETCDLRPLKEDDSSPDSSFNNSNNSSFSDKMKYAVTPLTENKPQQQREATPPVSPSHVNPAFVSNETETETLELSSRRQDAPLEEVSQSPAKGSAKQPQANQQQQQSSSYQFLPTLSPNQTQLTQTGVPPVALALPLGTSTTPRMVEDKRTKAVTVSNPVYNEGGRGSRTTTIRDFSVPKPPGIIKNDSNNAVNRFQIASSAKAPKEIPNDGGTNSGSSTETKDNKGIQRNKSSASIPTEPDSKQAKVDYVAAAKSLLNSSLERVNSMREGDDKDKK